VHGMKKKIGLTALGLTLALSVMASDVASAEDVVEDLAPASEPAPTTTAAPPTTAAPAPTTTAAPTTTTTPAPAAESEPRVDGGPSTRRGPDPRWIDYGDCGGGYTACHVAKAHQRDGLRQWRRGRWFWWGGDRVRGHRGETWENFRREARQVRAYSYALAVQRQREALVAKWDGVANCESGGNWSINTGNGYYGGLQFSMGTWQAYGGQGMPHQQPAWYQSKIAERVRVDSGLGHWPNCGRYYG
jgi:hypothetical protein